MHRKNIKVISRSFKRTWRFYVRLFLNVTILFFLIGNILAFYINSDVIVILTVSVLYKICICRECILVNVFTVTSQYAYNMHVETR